MSQNLAARGKDERNQINVDLAASSFAYKERMNIPVNPLEVEAQQPEELREYFRQRVQFYRSIALTLPRPSDPVYQKDSDADK